MPLSGEPRITLGATSLGQQASSTLYVQLTRWALWAFSHMTKLLAVATLLIATVHFVSADPEVGSYDEFMQGAMIVYTNDVTPSMDNSVAFLEYLNEKWGTIGCSDTCFQAGYDEAKMFVFTHKEK